MTERRVLARHEVMHPDGRQFLLYGDVDEGTLAAIAAQLAAEVAAVAVGQADVEQDGIVAGVVAG